MEVVGSRFLDVVLLADAEEEVVLLDEALVDDGLDVVVDGETAVDVMVVVEAGGTMMIGGSGIWTFTGGAAGGATVVEVSVMVAVLVGAGITSGATTGGTSAVGGIAAGAGVDVAELAGALVLGGAAIPTTVPGFAPVAADSSATGRSWADSPHPARMTIGMRQSAARVRRSL